MSTDLKDLRALEAELTGEDRRLVATIAAELLERFYVHRIGASEARVAHAVETLRDLAGGADGLGERAFHDRMIAIFSGLRDRHTHYLLPTVFQRHVASLPFIVRPARIEDEDHLVVVAANGDFENGFAAGARIERWNDVPWREAVRARAETTDGAHPAAREARAISTLTARPAWLLPVPDEDAVRLTFRNADGAEAEIEIPWQVQSMAPPRPSGLLEATDVLAETLLDLEEGAFPPRIGPRAVALAEAGTGYLRLPRFNMEPDAFVAGVVEALRSQPAGGLVLDLRGNPGGIIQSGERILQLFSSRSIKPVDWQFRCTPEALRFCEFVAGDPRFQAFAPIFAAYLPSLASGLSDGEPFSNALPTTTTGEANDLGRLYRGPCVLVVDALTYSVGDLVASCFQDHEIGPILGVDPATGAGGSNDLSYELIAMGLPDVFPALPKGASFRVSVRRGLRVHRNAGVPIEGAGVAADRTHLSTLDDRLHGDRDLAAQARALLTAASGQA